MPPEPRGPRHLRRTVWTVAAAAAVLVLLCVGCNAGGALLGRYGPGGSSPSPSPSPLAKGDCVKPAGPGDYVRASCKDAKRTGAVLGVIKGGEYLAQNCDPAADQMIAQEFAVLCVRHAGTRHVAAPGYGGGVIVAGDCVRLRLEMMLANPTEVPCGQPGYEGKVVARVKTEADCKAPAVRFEQLIVERAPVLCLAAGPGMAGPGQCLHVQDSKVQLAAVPCSAAATTAKVLARKPDGAACPRGTTSYTYDFDGLPRTRIICLREN